MTGQLFKTEHSLVANANIYLVCADILFLFVARIVLQCLSLCLCCQTPFIPLYFFIIAGLFLCAIFDSLHWNKIGTFIGSINPANQLLCDVTSAYTEAACKWKASTCLSWTLQHLWQFSLLCLCCIIIKMVRSWRFEFMAHQGNVVEVGGGQ